MARNFRTILEQMAPQRREKIAARTSELLAELPLFELRKARELSQEELAATLGVNQATISKLERRTDMYISTMRRFVDAMGGELQITARFPEGVVAIDQFSTITSEERKMAQKKTTGSKAATRASKTLRSKATSKTSKAAAGSALSQTRAPKKTTSGKSASAASRTLRDGRTSKASKSAAGSALSQKPSTRSKK
jgi:transcriptional regulator with XRE-family HTH domain